MTTTSTSTRLILAGLTGAVVFLAAELVQAGSIVKAVQEEGVTLNLNGVPVVVKPPSGGGSTVRLPASAEATAEKMHTTAALVGLGAVLLVVIIA